MTPTPANDFGIIKMTPQQQNEAIAKWMGWTKGRVSVLGSWISPQGLRDDLPKYCSDLNAMHEVESNLKSKGAGQWTDYLVRLGLNHGMVDGRSYLLAWNFTHATAAQRAEALLKTLSLWVEEPK